jgi:proline dehydrogenase
MLKRLLLLAADNQRLERLVATNPRTRKLVSRFVAGTTLAEAVSATKELNARHIDVSLDLLGETVEHLQEADVALHGYLDAVSAIAEQCPGNTLSVKLSQLGIGLDAAVCAVHLKTLIQAAREVDVRLEIDMEHSSVGPATLEAFRGVLDEHPATRVAIQAAMRRTPNDLASFEEVKPRIRLVKGAFLETRERALQDQHEVTAQFLYLTDWALENLPDPAFGTHDDVCIDHAKASGVRLGVDRSDYEFQMLYGVRRDLQQKLADEGYRIRVYLPYGTDWYPYLMRRMAERPANLIFFLRSLVSG